MASKVDLENMVKTLQAQLGNSDRSDEENDALYQEMLDAYRELSDIQEEEARNQREAWAALARREEKKQQVDEVKHQIETIRYEEYLRRREADRDLEYEFMRRIQEQERKRNSNRDQQRR